MDMEHLSAVCTGLGTVREDEEGNEVYVKHPDCLGTCKYGKHWNVWFPGNSSLPLLVQLVEWIQFGKYVTSITWVCASMR